MYRSNGAPFEDIAREYFRTNLGDYRSKPIHPPPPNRLYTHVVAAQRVPFSRYTPRYATLKPPLVEQIIELAVSLCRTDRECQETLSALLSLNYEFRYTTIELVFSGRIRISRVTKRRVLYWSCMYLHQAPFYQSPIPTFSILSFSDYGHIFVFDDLSRCHPELLFTFAMRLFHLVSCDMPFAKEPMSNRSKRAHSFTLLFDKRHEHAFTHPQAFVLSPFVREMASAFLRVRSLHVPLVAHHLARTDFGWINWYLKMIRFFDIEDALFEQCIVSLIGAARHEPVIDYIHQNPNSILSSLFYANRKTCFAVAFQEGHVAMTRRLYQLVSGVIDIQLMRHTSHRLRLYEAYFGVPPPRSFSQPLPLTFSPQHYTLIKSLGARQINTLRTHLLQDLLPDRVAQLTLASCVRLLGRVIDEATLLLCVPYTLTMYLFGIHFDSVACAFASYLQYTTWKVLNFEQTCIERELEARFQQDVGAKGEWVDHSVNCVLRVYISELIALIDRCHSMVNEAHGDAAIEQTCNLVYSMVYRILLVDMSHVFEGCSDVPTQPSIFTMH